ncbi:MAG: tetratricopeptide repeat protein [Bryobacteraceae bacterium]
MKFLLRSIFIWAALCSFTMAQLPLQQAVKLTRERRYREAARMLQGVAEPSPLNQRIAFHRLKAAIASGLHENAEAARQMRSALALAPDNPGLLLATALAELRAGYLDDALRHARQSGNTAVAQQLTGDIQEKRGQYVKAAEAYQAAVALAPDREEYRIALGFELIKHQTFRPAIDMLQESSSLFPKSAKIRTLLGIADYADGDLKEARAALESAISLDPKLESAYRCLADIVLQSSAPPTRQIVDSLCGWNPVVCSAMKLRVARNTQNAKLESEALAGLKRAPPGDAVGHCELARAYEWSGKLTDARTQMEDCVRLEETPQNHYRLGIIYRRLGLDQLAREQMDLRNQTLRKMSEQTAEGLNALRTFRYSLK